MSDGDQFSGEKESRVRGTGVASLPGCGQRVGKEDLLYMGWSEKASVKMHFQFEQIPEGSKGRSNTYLEEGSATTRP